MVGQPLNNGASRPLEIIDRSVDKTTSPEAAPSVSAQTVWIRNTMGLGKGAIRARSDRVIVLGSPNESVESLRGRTHWDVSHC